jgi:hypothetical protein
MNITVKICRHNQPRHPERSITSMQQAGSLVQDIIDELAPWPEHVIVAPPGYAPLIGDQHPDYSLPVSQSRKLWAIRDAVRSRMISLGVEHQMPDIQLLTAEGAAVTLWGRPAARYQVKPSFFAGMQADSVFEGCPVNAGAPDII